MRVGGKVVGRPSLMGLEDNPEVPSKLLRHVVGEVEADSLEEDVTADWGAIIENSIGYQQARHRLEFLDSLDALDSDPKTLELQMHFALEKNLWVFGVEFSLMTSNKTLARTIEEYTGKKFKGNRKDKRPDLFLARDAHGRHLLIEFKRPKDDVGRDAEAQAKKYRDDLTPDFGAMTIIIIGGKVDPSMSSSYTESDVHFLNYKSLISRARHSLQWLLGELGTDA